MSSTDVGRTLHRYVSGRVMHFNQDLLGAGADIRPPARTGCLSECLAERTIAREALDRTRDSRRGYAPTMLERMIRCFILPRCR
jgi:hypothetical protein